MKISILCSSKDHPVNTYLTEWVAEISICHEVDVCRDQSTLLGGDLLFLISCTEVVQSHYRELYQKTLVIHASDLPQGKGWSPHIWQIIEGKTQIVVS